MNNAAPVKVMIADDSLLVRGLLRTIVEKDPELEIVATCVDGESALSDYKSYKPDIVLMDIEMPNMDGLTALFKILEYDDKARVVMCSSLTQSGAEETYKALNIGALDCLAKPSSQEIDRGDSFENKLQRMLKSLGRDSHPERLSPSAAKTTSTNNENAPTLHTTNAAYTLQSFPAKFHPRFPVAIAIGASTGGPQALPELFQSINKKILLPIFITQHIPKGFAEYLAEQIHKRSDFPTHVAEEGMPVQPGHVYIATPGMHMGVTEGAGKKITLIDSDPVHFCKPSISVMLDSIRSSYNGHIISVMLTGMGGDGMDACKALIDDDKQNIIVAQDEETSVVWGIPGAVVKNNLAHAVLPLSEIGVCINKLVQRQTV